MTVRLGPLGGVLLDVGLDVEVREQDEEHPTVEQNYVAEGQSQIKNSYDYVFP